MYLNRLEAILWKENLLWICLFLLIYLIINLYCKEWWGHTDMFLFLFKKQLIVTMKYNKSNYVQYFFVLLIFYKWNYKNLLILFLERHFKDTLVESQFLLSKYHIIHLLVLFICKHKNIKYMVILKQKSIWDWIQLVDTIQEWFT